MTGRLLRIRPNTRREFASPFHLLKCCGVEQIQFFIIQVFDGITQVFGQDMPLRSGQGCRRCGRWWRRRSISGRSSGEEVRRSLLATFAFHGMIMVPRMEGSQRPSVDDCSESTEAIGLCQLLRCLPPLSRPPLGWRDSHSLHPEKDIRSWPRSWQRSFGCLSRFWQVLHRYKNLTKARPSRFRGVHSTSTKMQKSPYFKGFSASRKAAVALKNFPGSRREIHRRNSIK